MSRPIVVGILLTIALALPAAASALCVSLEPPALTPRFLLLVAQLSALTDTKFAEFD
jgi:hypothetical protein